MFASPGSAHPFFTGKTFKNRGDFFKKFILQSTIDIRMTQTDKILLKEIPAP